MGAALYAGLGGELKAKGLGGGGGDGQAHECKDCERMFPNKYRCPTRPRPPPSFPTAPPHPFPGAGRNSMSAGPQSTGGALTGPGRQGQRR